MICISLVLIGVNLLNPYIFKYLIDDVITIKEMSNFKYVVIALLSVYFVKLGLEYLNLKFSNSLLNKFVTMVRQDLFNKLFNIKYIDFCKYDYADLKMRFWDDVNSLENFLHYQIMDYFYTLITVVVMIVILLLINPFLTLICLLILPLVFIVNMLLSKQTKDVNEKIRKSTQEYSKDTHGVLQYLKEIKTHNAQYEFTERIKSHRKVLAKLGYQNIMCWSFWEVFNDFKSNYLTKVLVYIVGVFFVVNNQISVGALLMYAEYFQVFFAAIDTLNYKRSDFKMNLPYYNRIIEILDEKNENLGAVMIDDICSVSVENLSYRYQENNKILFTNINFGLSKGEKIIVIGKSGCGKTTLLNLLLGLKDKQAGEIKINNCQFKKINQYSYFENVGIVMKDSMFFNLSIKENLLLSKPDATDNEIEIACKQANILEYIKSQPLEFGTIIGENGIKLSGGEKQRLAIARVFLRKPSMVFLDEATSALDEKNENYIYNSLFENLKNSIFIIVTHKKNSLLDGYKVLDLSEHR